MTMDMTVKEYAYLLLTQYEIIGESVLKTKLLEVYKESCVDCILKEIREDKKHVQVWKLDDGDNLLLLRKD